MRKRIVLLLIAVLALACAPLAGCTRIGGVKGKLVIASFEGGYGNTWASALRDAYVAHNPEADVQVECNALVRDDAVAALESNISSVDLYFIDGASVGSYLENYDSLADISELYESTPKAGEKTENVKIKDKIAPEVVSEMTYGGDRAEFVGKYYTVPSPSGPCSLILNKDALDAALGAGNWEAPRTTDEMMTLADRIKEADAKVNVAGINHTIYPFIFGGTAPEYWRYLYYPWIAQYDGFEAWNDLQSYRIDGEYDQAAFAPPGKAIAFSLMERILKRTNGYCDPTSLGNKYAESQKYFFQKRACMYVTGDWLEREMEAATQYTSELVMVKSPIISDLAGKLESEYSVSLGATAAEKDGALSRIVAAVDNGETSASGVSQEVFDAVKTSRSFVYSLANNAIGLVPKCSVNQDMVLDFLRFMYSDEGIEIVQRESKANLPMAVRKSAEGGEGKSGFRRSVDAIMGGDVTYIFSSNRDPIRYRAGVGEFMSKEELEVAFSKKTGALTASEFLNKEKTSLAKSWPEYMKLVA